MPHDRTKRPRTVFECRPLLMCSVLEKMVSAGPRAFLEAPHRMLEVEVRGIRKERL
jgi:hypothetical protein